MKANMWNILTMNRFNALKMCIVICTVLILLSVYYLKHQVKKQTYAQTTYDQKDLKHRVKMQTPPQTIYDQKAEFRVIKHIKGVHSFSNVCIEDFTTSKLENGLKTVFNETKKIVIYGNNSQADGTVITLRVAGSGNTDWNHWQIQFRQQTLPAENKMLLRDTAFFVQPTCPGNFFHFFFDTFIPLYSVVGLSNRLHPGARNQILYRTPLVGSVEGKCNTRRRYEGFLRTLYIDEFHDVFYKLPSNTCFRHAVFGNTPLLRRHRDVVDHVLRSYKFSLHSSRNTSDLYVTFIKRKDRRVLNAEEIISFVKEVGFKNVRIVEFNNKSIHYQLEIMSTSNVLIGTQGAGLLWSVFMHEGSYLIELAWPQKHWRFFYNKFVPNFGMKWRGVGVEDVRLNWTSYANNVRGGVPVSEAEKPIMIRDHPKSNAENIWKWSDIVVKKNEILGTLQKVFNELKAIH